MKKNTFKTDKNDNSSDNLKDKMYVTFVILYRFHFEK